MYKNLKALIPFTFGVGQAAAHLCQWLQAGIMDYSTLAIKAPGPLQVYGGAGSLRMT